MIDIKQVSKYYGKAAANKDITMRVEAGELAVLLGPNGAGKSTLIKCICGLLRFDGCITICGFENHTLQAKAVLGYVPELPAMYAMLTVEEHLQFIAKAYRLHDWRALADELLQRFELDDKRNKLGQELSKGMQQKVSICCALLPQPKAVVFDEPFVGLDPHAIRELKAIMRTLRGEGVSILVSTHMIDSMEETWDTTHILKDGRLVRTCRRQEMGSAESLEELYFAITEGARTDGEDAK